ncbi:trimeric intracellular cation channel family protein [Wielerella bovis]|uniref:trimeric intracellular cation channel family protein n=1 Tax=Wielerella bovis TaxID=2917790 RepID=UPI0020198A5E|nr:trimeric intracellular cation channel family protein [Wielerella bovis]ULJ62200.1 trimeric intracellular cation channel family protein [Wielerella bovis]
MTYEIDLPQAQTIVYALDMVGVGASTIAASVLAKRLKLDITGAFIISVLGSIGGGTVRDLLINRHPIFWLRDLNYLSLILFLCVLTLIFYHYFEKIDRSLRWFDAIGLAAFTIIGVQAALSRGMSAPIAICMGAMTGAGGGVLRDIVCRQIPLVLQKEIYITASIVGSVYYIMLQDTGINAWFHSISSIAFIVVVRMLAVYRQWNLPDITLKMKEK